MPPSVAKGDQRNLSAVVGRRSIKQHTAKPESGQVAFRYASPGPSAITRAVKKGGRIGVTPKAFAVATEKATSPANAIRMQNATPASPTTETDTRKHKR